MPHYSFVGVIMNNVLLEKKLIEEVKNKNYSFYLSTSFTSKSSYTPQIFAIENGKYTKTLLRQLGLKTSDFTDVKLKNIIHERPLVIIKGFNKNKIAIPDNIFLLNLLKNSLSVINKKDYSNSLEKYLKNINYLVLIDNIFQATEKLQYFQLFSKKETFKSTNLKQLNSFFDSTLNAQEKEDAFYSFVEKRSKELKDINIEKKLENHLKEYYSYNPDYIKKFIPLSTYLEHQLNNSELDIFDSYKYTLSVVYSIQKASKILGFPLNKLDSTISKLLKSISEYHQSNLHFLSSTDDKKHVVIQSNYQELTSEYVQNTIKTFLTHLINNPIKIDDEYTKKWYLNKVFSDKFAANSKTQLPKINKI